MKEYDGHETGSVATQAPASPVKKAPTYTRLPSKYNLPKHQIYKEPTMVKRSAEEEFHRYKSGPVSPDYTDLIEYWAVCDRIVSDFQSDKLRRLRNKNIQGCMLWRWITCLFRPPPCPANKFFPQLGKQTPSDEIESIRN